jgi:hypothetical protein
LRLGVENVGTIRKDIWRLLRKKGCSTAKKKAGECRGKYFVVHVVGSFGCNALCSTPIQMSALGETPHEVWRNVRHGADKFLLESAGLVPVDNVDELPRILIELKLELSFFVND